MIVTSPRSGIRLFGRPFPLSSAAKLRLLYFSLPARAFHTHLYTHIYSYKHTRARQHAHTRTCTQPHTHMYTHTRARGYTHTHTHTHTHARARTHAHARTHARTQTDLTRCFHALEWRIFVGVGDIAVLWNIHNQSFSFFFYLFHHKQRYVQNGNNGNNVQTKINAKLMPNAQHSTHKSALYHWAIAQHT